MAAIDYSMINTSDGMPGVLFQKAILTGRSQVILSWDLPSGWVTTMEEVMENKLIISGRTQQNDWGTNGWIHLSPQIARHKMAGVHYLFQGFSVVIPV